MIRFEEVPQPQKFEEQARRPGLKWLRDNPPPKRPRDYWSRFKPQLADGFWNLCGYSCMYEPVGTVDHFLSCKHERRLAYEWSNYRFSASWINSSKQNVDSGVLDPLEVEDGWFEIHLPSLQLVLTDRVPEALKSKAQFTIERLHLIDDMRVIRQREQWYQLYCEGKLNLECLRKCAPLIATAVEKQKAKVDGKKTQ